MESYLLRFERFAKINVWPKENWAVHLSALLSAKALDTYDRLDDHESTDYDSVKRALLKRHNLISDGFNVKFRNSRPEVGERIGQFKTRLETYLDRWIELSGWNKSSVDDWRDLILYEQIINACGRELRTFLKERNPKRCSEIVTLAEQYIEAHGEKNQFSKGGAATFCPSEKLKSESTGEVEDKMSCHGCGKSGHLEQNCFKRGAPKNPSQLRCDHCKKLGHTKEGCWNLKKAATTVVQGDCNGQSNPSI